MAKEKKTHEKFVEQLISEGIPRIHSKESAVDALDFLTEIQDSIYKEQHE